MKPEVLLTCCFASLRFSSIPLVSPPITAPIRPHFDLGRADLGGDTSELSERRREREEPEPISKI